MGSTNFQTACCLHSISIDLTRVSNVFRLCLSATLFEGSVHSAPGIAKTVELGMRNSDKTSGVNLLKL